MLQKDLVQNLENLRDCVDDVYGDVAYPESEETIRKVCSNLMGISFMIDALVSRIESEGVREC